MTTTTTTTVNLQMVTPTTPVPLNSAYYEPMGTVEIQLTQRFHTQHRNLAGQVTKVEFHQDPKSWFMFYIPFPVLSQSPHLCNLSILNVLLTSNLEHELCTSLAPTIADFAVNYTQGSLGFFIKADVEVAHVELVDDGEDEEEEEEEEQGEEEDEDEMVQMELLMMDSLDFVQKMGASRSMIDKLKKERKVDSGGELSTCMICLEEFSGVIQLIQMPCSHLFHDSCICRWLEEKNSCPICRCELDDDD